jgi:hypothetical protein
VRGEGPQVQRHIAPQDGGATIRQGWKPECGFLNYGWEGYSEAILLYALALGSPSHPITADGFRAWTATYQWENLYGHDLLYAGPLCGGRRRWSALTLPWCTFTDPEIAHVGLCVREARDRDLPVKTFTVPMHDVDRAVTDAEDVGFVKIHVEERGDRILGATIVGRHAGEIINEITLAMVAGVGLGTLAQVIHPYPTQRVDQNRRSDRSARCKPAEFDRRTGRQTYSGRASQEVSNKGFGALPRRTARLTSTWALTLTAAVEVDVAVDVEAIVDLDVDLRVRSSSSASRPRW